MAGLSGSLLSYHAVLAVKDECADALAAWRRSSILDSCARRDPRDAGQSRPKSA